MANSLIEISLEKFKPLKKTARQSFNNDSRADAIRNSFNSMILPFMSNSSEMSEVPSEYLFPNVCQENSNEIYKFGKCVVVGEYFNDGVIVPEGFSVAFNRLYNCAPLISFVNGAEKYISFLHVLAKSSDPDGVDRQVKHWMEVVANLGDISETIFAPRTNFSSADTKYQNAIEYMVNRSKKTIVLARNIEEINGIANAKGVYFDKCGYHLWEK